MAVEVPGELFIAYEELERDEVRFSLFDGLDRIVDFFANAFQDLALVHLHVEAVNDRDVQVRVLHDWSGSCMVCKLKWKRQTISMA